MKRLIFIMILGFAIPGYAINLSDVRPVDPRYTDDQIASEVLITDANSRTDETTVEGWLDELAEYVVSGIITDNATSLTGSGSITVTETQCYRGKLKDDGLTGAADIELDDLEDDVSIVILINYGTYGISVCPPTGEKLRVDISGTMTWLDANDETDLSSDEGDMFIAHRRYSNTETAWYWEIRAIEGSITDGGVAD